MLLPSLATSSSRYGFPDPSQDMLLYCPREFSLRKLYGPFTDSPDERYIAPFPRFPEKNFVVGASITRLCSAPPTWKDSFPFSLLYNCHFSEPSAIERSAPRYFSFLPPVPLLRIELLFMGPSSSLRSSFRRALLLSPPAQPCTRLVRCLFTFHTWM